MKRFWTAALADPKYSQNTVAVASHKGTLIGIAMAGPVLTGAGELWQLHLLYAYAAFHGRRAVGSNGPNDSGSKRPLTGSP